MVYFTLPTSNFCHVRVTLEIILLNFYKYEARYLTSWLPQGTGCKAIPCLCAQVQCSISLCSMRCCLSDKTDAAATLWVALSTVWAGAFTPRVCQTSLDFIWKILSTFLWGCLPGLAWEFLTIGQARVYT